VVRNPIKDQIAIVGVGTTGLTRDAGTKSQAALALEACVAAIADAGLARQDIDGVVGTQPTAKYMTAALGLPRVTHDSNPAMPMLFSVVDAMNAIYSGACETVVVYHSVYRSPSVSRAAAADPFRRHVGRHGAAPSASPQGRVDPEIADYSSWASRYLYEYGASRDVFGYIAINGRSGALDNPGAVQRTPITMDDYLAARMVRDPLCLLDMDMPVDGADAFVLTRVERARDLPQPSVLIHAAATALAAQTHYDQIDFTHHGQHLVAEILRSKSDLWIDDIDLFFAYDGFTNIAVQWIESMGWCGPGQAGDFLKSNWDTVQNKIKIGGRVLVNPHGGNLSEGATQGSGHIREAVMQLRGGAGARQVPDARAALLALGGFIFNAQGVILRTN
jgi:acetyl-CoA acetyltransferase